MTHVEIAGLLRSVVLDAYLRDTDRAYLLAKDRYHRAEARGGDGFNAQQFLLDWYRSNPSAVDDM